MNIQANFLWIPNQFGGHGSEPWAGMKLEAKWQHSNAQDSSSDRDLVCEELSAFDPSTNMGVGKFRFYLSPVEDTSEGTILELRNGSRLLAVARIGF